MRVLLDATAGARVHRSGIGHYVHELIGALAATGHCQLKLGVRLSKRDGAGALPRPTGVSSGTYWLDDLWDRWFLRGTDVYHGLDARLTPCRRPARVVTLHDLFSLERDDLAGDSFRSKKQQRYHQIAAQADAVICVSAETRRRFVEVYPAAAARCHVVHHGISAQFQPAPAERVADLRRRLGVEAPFLLFVGLLSTRKNLVPLIQAYDRLAARRDDLHLVLAGEASHGFEEVETALAAMGHRDRVVLPGFVAVEDLPVLYSTAELFVFPSLGEGFGLPVLEALACGTPVVASDLAVFEEIGGEHVTRVNTADGDAFETALATELERGPDRPDPADWLARFTWERAAGQTLEVYEKARNVSSGGTVG